MVVRLRVNPLHGILVQLGIVRRIVDLLRLQLVQEW